MRRILLIGSGGCGKSTLARQMGEVLGLEVIHLDKLFWHPGWVETPREEFRRLQEELVRRETWIIDGNYSATIETRLAAADTVIFLDLPRTLCFFRALKRVFKYSGTGVSRPDMGEGCPERVDWQFLKWIWNYPKNRRPAVLERLAALPPSVKVIRLRSRREVAGFLTGACSDFGAT